jgi:uncharacterized protein (TIGR03086 family)
VSRTFKTTGTSTRQAEGMADEIPYFPAPSLPVMCDPAQARSLLEPVLTDLAGLVDVPDDALDRATPCAEYPIGALRDHVLGWLQFFAAAAGDPRRATTRPDPAAYRAADDPRKPSDVVRAAAGDLAAALDRGVLGGRVVMSQAEMDGPAVLAMALGEYVVHGWDLAVSTGAAWTPSDQACAVSLDFFTATVVPEYRGPDGGFFLDEVPVPDDAPILDRLLGFAGRDPHWRA